MSQQPETERVPRWQALGNGQAPQGVTVNSGKTVTRPKVSKRIDPEKARKIVIRLLMASHYGFALYSSTRGIQLAYNIAGGWDAFGMMFGILMADVVLVASMEGIRHGVFVGLQKFLGVLAYGFSAVGICLATFAHGANYEFQLWYVHSMLPFEAVTMSFYSFILLCTFLDVMNDNRDRAVKLFETWADTQAELLTHKLRLKRFYVDMQEAKKRNKDYKKALRRSGVGQRTRQQLRYAAEHSGNRIMGLLGLPAEIESSGDGQSKPVDVKPAKKGWSRFLRN